MVRIHAVPAFQDNYLWVLESHGHAAVVDPGDAAPVQRFLEEKGLQLDAILATHHHADHIGGVPELARRWKCPVFGPAHDGVDGLTRSLVEGDGMVVPGIDLGVKVLDVPGHIDIATVYVPPRAGVTVMEQLAQLGGVEEIWLNPGADHDMVVARALSIAAGSPRWR